MRKILSILFIFFYYYLGAQETSLVHFNKSFFVNGEVVWYKIYLPSSFPEGKKVIKVSVRSNAGVEVYQSHLVQQTGKAAWGWYKLPYDCPSGVYQFVFSAAYEEGNAPLLLARAEAPVFNDFDEIREKPEIPEEVVEGWPAGRSFTEELNVDISADKADYSPRSTAELTIKVRDLEGRPARAHLSVAITDDSLSGVSHPMFSTVKKGVSFVPGAVLEEDLAVTGRVFGPAGEAILRGCSVGAYLEDLNKIHYFKTTQTGEFELDIPGLSGPFPVHFRSYFPRDLQVRIDNQLSFPATSPALPFPPEVIRYLNLSRKRKSIYQLFQELESRLETESTQEKPALPVADKTYLLEKYQAFPDMFTLIKELFLPVEVRKEKEGRYSIRMFDPAFSIRTAFNQAPVFLIDGKLTGDEDFFMHLDLEKVKSISLFQTPEKINPIFGPIGNKGVIVVRSKNGDLGIPPGTEGNYYEFNGLQAAASYPVNMEGETRVSLHPVLYWHPALETDEQGILNLRVPLSDDRSRFKVEVLVQGMDGRRGTGQLLFEVR